ncbi:E3 ubiquitin-protein ligase RNF220-like [Bombina bombina]|uniref:E3 ubiquitin-protein ligase RNF220-like n=1 Tax=Bombina bombina TaxID=8345 RepID=UPI00235AD783|nr:E3 ubiquitin-protein ligase RNF220-like [Bombina bombina]
MDSSSGMINTLTSPALLVMATSSDGSLGGTQQPPIYTVPMSMEKPPQISYLSPAYPLLYSSQDHLTTACPPQLLSLAPQYSHHRLERGGVGVLGYGALHHFSAFHLPEGVERLQASFMNPKRLKGESEHLQMRYLPMEPGLEASHVSSGAGIPQTSQHSSTKPRQISNKREKKMTICLPLICPLCNKCLQKEELSQHLQQEMDLLHQVSDREPDASLDSTHYIPQSPMQGVSSPCQSPLNTFEDGHKLDRQQTFQQVKWNREERLGVRAGKCKRARVNICESESSQPQRPAPVEGESCWDEEILSPGKSTHESERPKCCLSSAKDNKVESAFTTCATYISPLENQSLKIAEQSPGTKFGFPVIVKSTDNIRVFRISPKPVFYNRHSITGGRFGDCIVSPGISSPSHSEESDSEEGPTVNTSRVNEESLESLRKKIQELTEKLRNAHTCHICLDSYSIPVTSIQCWHTHCEGCWLRALGTKKLCPQCNTITSPCDLRRVYL